MLLASINMVNIGGVSNIRDQTNIARDLRDHLKHVSSYNLEKSYGDDNHNIVTIVMNGIGTDVNGARWCGAWAQDFHTKWEQKFHAAMAALPEWEEPSNSQVKEYCDDLGQWVRGCGERQSEIGGHSGDRGPGIEEERWISLMPKATQERHTREWARANGGQFPVVASSKPVTHYNH